MEGGKSREESDLQEIKELSECGTQMQLPQAGLGWKFKDNIKTNKQTKLREEKCGRKQPGKVRRGLFLSVSFTLLLPRQPHTE